MKTSWPGLALLIVITALSSALALPALLRPESVIEFVRMFSFC